MTFNCSKCGKDYYFVLGSEHNCEPGWNTSFTSPTVHTDLGINRDPVRFDSLSVKPLGQQVMDQLSPSPHQPLYPFKIGPLG